MSMKRGLTVLFQGLAMLAIGAVGCSSSSLTSQHCVLPKSASHDDAVAAYANWKDVLLTSDGAGGFLRVRRPNSKNAVVNSTVSEGIAYGMLLAVFMDDQSTFDALFSYSQLHLDANGLMNWYVGPAGETLGEGAATDADEDIAFALIVAAQKWAKKGSLSEDYAELARRQIALVWSFEVSPEAPHTILAGDTWGSDPARNPSYFAPAYYRAFARFTKNDAWLDVVESSYDIIEASLNATSGNADNGLVPAWCDVAGTPLTVNGVSHFQFDACRTPFRIGQDYCWNGETRALSYLQKISGFYEGIGLDHLIDGFNLDGSPHPEFSVDGSRAAAFVGPAAVGAMFSSEHADFTNAAYGDLISKDALIIGQDGYDNLGSIYYNTSWRVLSLIMLDGTLQDPTVDG